MFVRAVSAVCRPPGRTFIERRYSLFKKLFQGANKQQANPNETKEQGKQAQPEQQPKVEKEPPQPIKRKLDSHTDFAQLKRKHSKHIPSNVGDAGFEEVLFWSSGVINFEEVLTLTAAFNRVWDQLPDRKAPESYQFDEFKKKVSSMAGLARNLYDLYVLSQFGKLYGIKSDQFWGGIEEKFGRKVTSKDMNQSELPLAVGVFMNFSLLKMGEDIYHRTEQLAYFFESSLTVDDVGRLLAGLHNVRKGTPEMIAKLVANFLRNLDHASKESIVLVIPVFPFIEGFKSDNYTDLEKHILNKDLIQQMNVYELGEVAKGFGYSRGSQQLWVTLEAQILKQQLKLQWIDSIVFGFLSSYRCSNKIVEKMVPFVQQNLANIHPKILSEISKDFYMYELDNKALFERIEGTIIEWLRHVNQVQPQELLLVAKNYCLTRHGSRDIYKMLEEVIITRMNDIKSDRFIFDSLMTVYENSDLCSLDLHNLFRFLSC